MTASPQVREYPWASLDHTTHEAARAFRAVRRWTDTVVDLARVSSALRDVIGADVEVRVRSVDPAAPPAGLSDGAGVRLGRADGRGATRGTSDAFEILVEAERALVACVLRRAVTRKVQIPIDPAGRLDAGAYGALAAVVLAAARRASAEGPLRVVSAGPAEVLERDLATSDTPGIAVRLTVLLDHDAFDARVVVPRSAVDRVPPAPWRGDDLEAMGTVPLSMPLVASAFAATTVDVAALQVGDALVPTSFGLARQGARLVGDLWLAAPAATHGHRAQLGADGRLVLVGGLEPLSKGTSGEAAMGDVDDNAQLIEAVGDVPVLVRVEVGEATMRAREWARLGPGDVVTLGRRVGESVLVRVGGVPVARGALVDVDGEVGVRIVERLASTAGAA